MKKLFFLFIACTGLLFCPCSFVLAQGVGINSLGIPADNSAGLDVNFNNKGLLIPRMSQTERDAIADPAVGLQVYNLTTNCLNIWIGSTWKQICGDCDFNSPVTANNGPLCEGSTLNLTATTIPGAVYQWSGPNGFTSSLQNPVISNATAAASGSYSLTATKNGCTSTPQSTVATVNAIPVTPTAGNSSPVCEGASLNLTASTIVGATYTWTGPNGYSASVQNPIIANAQLTTAGLYNATATLNGCLSAVGTTSVTVNALPASTFSPVSGLVNTAINFTPTVTGASYSWTFANGSPSTGTNQNPSVTWSSMGTYNVTLTVTSDDDCSSTHTTAVTINSPTVVPFASPGATSWTAPDGVTSVVVIAIGGGGGGGAGGGGTGGGGGGGYSKSIETVVPGQSYSIVVGAGGLESTSSSWWLAQSGTTSSFNGTVIANGGTGANNDGTRKAGGTASGGNILNLAGGYGGASNEAGEGGPTGGGGGFNNFNGGTANQPYGGNGGAGNSNNSIGGGNGANYGGGGGGGHSRPFGTPNTNCKGANGAVILTY